MINTKTGAHALPMSLLLGSLSIFSLAASASNKAVQGGYFKADLASVRFDLPGYKDGFGVVNLAPVSGPFLTKGENQSGEALTLTGGVVSQYPIEQLDGLLFFEGSAFHSRSDESYSTQLGSDSAGNGIRLGLFNGSNGYNSSSPAPLNYRLTSEVEHLGAYLAVGVQHQAAGWNMRYQVGPQLMSLNQDYKLYGSSPSDATSFYNRHETLDTDYVGLRLAVSGDHALSAKLQVEIGLGLSALAMDADYEGSDDRQFGGGSSLSRSLHETTYGADLKLALRYAFTPTLEVGLNLGLNYLDKVPDIVHATGATGNATFVPARLDTSHMLVQQTGIALRKLF